MRANDDLDDVWGGDSDDGAPAERAQLDREWAARQQQFYNTGYREGLDAGKELTLQPGFNAGFAEGAHAGFEFGLARGALHTLAVLHQGPPDANAKVQELLQQLTALPARAVMRDTCLALLAQPPIDPLQQQLQAALEQLSLTEGLKPPPAAAAVAAEADAEAGDAPGGPSDPNAAASSSSSSRRGLEPQGGTTEHNRSSSGNLEQPRTPLPQQLVAHVKGQLAELGFAVGSAPPIAAAAAAVASPAGG